MKKLNLLPFRNRNNMCCKIKQNYNKEVPLIQNRDSQINTLLNCHNFQEYQKMKKIMENGNPNLIPRKSKCVPTVHRLPHLRYQFKKNNNNPVK